MGVVYFFYAPFDVRLGEKKAADEEIMTVVQPDIVVVCDKKKLDDAGCKGAPDLVIEITSPSTLSVDAVKKFALYEKHGVKEYWIVFTEGAYVSVNRLGANRHYGRPDSYVPDDTLTSPSLPGLRIEVGTLFDIGKKETKAPAGRRKPPSRRRA